MVRDQPHALTVGSGIRDPSTATIRWVLPGFDNGSRQAFWTHSRSGLQRRTDDRSLYPTYGTHMELAMVGPSTVRATAISRPDVSTSEMWH